MEDTYLSIGGLVFHLHHPRLLVQDSGFEPFLTDGLGDIAVDYREDPQVAEEETWISLDGTQVTVRFAPHIAEHFTALRGCLIHLPVEKLLLGHSRFFLHASFVTSAWGGLLFTANSGVGKSTQAELWRQHRGSTVINGDRVILAKEDAWLGYGSLYAGSSDYYVNRREPIGAIILLEQGSENLVSPVSPGEAFRFLLRQVSVERQDPEAVDKLCDLLTDLIVSVPVYRLTCRPDAGAVDVLADALERGKAQ